MFLPSAKIIHTLFLAKKHEILQTQNFVKFHDSASFKSPFFDPLDIYFSVWYSVPIDYPKESPDMPQNFNAPADSDKKPQQTPPVPSKQPQTSTTTDSPATPGATKEPEKRETVADILSKGLNASELGILAAIRKEIADTDFISNFMFNDQASVSLKINRHISVSLRSPSSSEQEDLEAYLFGKDPFELFKDKDDAEIKKITEEDSSLNTIEAREIYLRTFPKSAADSRYARAYLAAMLMRLNNKPIGRTLKERFLEISKMPLYLFQQIYSYVGLFERAVKIELTDEDAIKN